MIFVLARYCIPTFFFCWRLRRIDAFASFLWLLVLCLHSVEFYLKTDTPDWLDTIKLGATSLCCLVGFAAAVATRKPASQRRARGRRSESEQWHFTKPFIRNSYSGCVLFGLLPLQSSSFFLHGCKPAICLQPSVPSCGCLHFVALGKHQCDLGENPTWWHCRGFKYRWVLEEPQQKANRRCNKNGNLLLNITAFCHSRKV